MARSTIDGLDETLRRIAEIPRAGRAARDDSLHDWADDTEDAAIRRVPIRTGTLRRDIDQRVYEGHGVAYVGVWKTEPAAKYAFFVEKGTSKMADQPFLRPAAEANNRRVAALLRRNFDRRMGA